MTDSRHPWTHSCDFIRSAGPVKPGEGVVLSRGDASQIRKKIAEAIGWTDEELANALSDAFQNRTEDDIQEEANRIIRRLGFQF